MENTDRNRDNALSAAEITRYLTGNARSLRVECREQVDSTNTRLREKAAEGAPEGTVLAAASQTGGRGRMGRQFYSPADTGLYLSLLLRPGFPASQALSITTAAAVAVCQALEALGAEKPGIKWVNDVFVSDRKVCGILTEAGFGGDGKLTYAVLGVGVNVFPPEGGFPPEIADIAGSAFPEKAPGLRNRLAAEILNRFLPLYKAIPTGEHVPLYRAYSFVPGRRVRVVRNPSDPAHEMVREALALDVDESCRLHVRYDDGTEEALQAGEIRLRV